MVTNEFKELVLNAVKSDRRRFDSDAVHARALDINKAAYSRINKHDFDQVLSDGTWMRLGNKFGVNTLAWNTAKTPVFNEIYLKLEACKSMSWNGIVCDLSDIGKTHTAKTFVKENKNAFYVDCSRSKTRMLLIKAIAAELGVRGENIESKLDNVINHLNSIYKPILILDEVGDLNYESFLELKAIMNGTEGRCSIFLIGADGLRAKMEKNKNKNKVGYEEIFSRLGSKYQRVTPEGEANVKEFKKLQGAMIIKANNPTVSINEIYSRSDGSLRRIKLELQKKNLVDRKDNTPIADSDNEE